MRAFGASFATFVEALRWRYVLDRGPHRKIEVMSSNRLLAGLMAAALLAGSVTAASAQATGTSNSGTDPGPGSNTTGTPNSGGGPPNPSK